MYPKKIEVPYLMRSFFVQIYRASAGNVKRSKEEAAADTEEEDEFGYTSSK